MIKNKNEFNLFNSKKNKNKIWITTDYKHEFLLTSVKSQTRFATINVTFWLSKVTFT